MFNENICIEILEENKVNTINDINDITDINYINSVNDINGNNINISFDSDNFVAKQLDYQENYLLADLKKIADYYGIITRKLKKEELVQEIVLFEANPENGRLYLKRLEGWYWLKELKKDPKLKQFIIF